MNSVTESSFTSEVFALTLQGEGIVKHPNGKIFFARGVWPGDCAEFTFNPEQLSQKQPAMAQLRALHRASPDRKEPICPHLGFSANACQGCSWMIAKESSQLHYKTLRVQKALENYALTQEKCQPIWQSPKNFGYRNRAQFKTNGKELGYVAATEPVIAPIEDCVVLNDAMRKVLKGLRKTLPNAKWRPQAGKNWVFLDCDADLNVADVLPNQKRPFKQGNTEQNHNLQAWLKKKMQTLPVAMPVAELFCGSGNFTQVMVALGFQNIFAVEADATAIFQLKQKQWPGVHAHVFDLYHARQWRTLQSDLQACEILVLDPPREGLQNKSKILNCMRKLKHIFYISCDPESLARDCRFLVTEKGFAIEEVQPVDLFPQTPHVEILAYLSK